MDESARRWVEKLSDPDPNTRREAVKALQAYDDPEIREYLEPLKSDPDTAVRLAAKRVTGRIRAQPSTSGSFSSSAGRPRSQAVSGSETASERAESAAEARKVRPAGSNPLMNYLYLAFHILQFQDDALIQAANDEDATLWATLFIAVAGAVAAPWAFLVIGMGIGAVFSVVFSVISFGMIWLISRLVGGQGSFLSFFRVQGLAHVVMWVNLIPLLGFFLAGLAMLLNIAVCVNNLRVTQKLSLLQAILVVLLPSFVLIAAMSTMVMIFGFGMLAFFGFAASGMGHAGFAPGGMGYGTPTMPFHPMPGHFPLRHH